MELDSKDRQILSILLEDSTKPIQTIAAQIGLTNNPCWRRIKRLQELGIISHYTVAIDHAKIGLGTIAFVTLKIENHNIEWLDRFANCVKNMPEIVECHRMTGDVDYILKIVVADLNHYDRVYRRLVSEVPGLADVSSTFSMEELKSKTSLITHNIAQESGKK